MIQDEKNRKKDLTAKMGRALKHYCDSITDVRSDDQPTDRQLSSQGKNDDGYQIGKDLHGVATTRINEGFYGKTTTICDHQIPHVELSTTNQLNKKEEEEEVDNPNDFYIRTFQISSKPYHCNKRSDNDLIEPNNIQIFPYRVPIGPRDPPQKENKLAKLKRLMPQVYTI